MHPLCALLEIVSGLNPIRLANDNIKLETQPPPKYNPALSGLMLKS
jgi:hypothetical protein